jgi:hypothetical protein
MPTRQEIVDEARSWLGTPFKHRGRTKGKAVDCVGVGVKTLEAKMGWTDIDVKDYSRLGNSKLLLELLLKYLVPKPVKDKKPGDIAWMKLDDNEPTHIGIISDKGIIHATVEARRCVEHPIDDYWESRIIRIFEIPGVM